MVYSLAQNQTSRLSGPCVSSFSMIFINSQYPVSSNSSSTPQNSSRSTVTPLRTSRLMSLNPLFSLPLKSLADPSNISSPQNRCCPLYSLFTFTTSELHQLFFFSFQPPNPLARYTCYIFLFCFLTYEIFSNCKFCLLC